MAPQPGGDIEFPDVHDSILEPLLALVSEIFNAIWSYVSGWVSFLIAHPIIGTPIVAFAFMVISSKFGVPRGYLEYCLHSLKQRGNLRDPNANAPNYQSTNQGENVPKASTQRQQSQGGKGGSDSRVPDGAGSSNRH